MKFQTRGSRYLEAQGWYGMLCNDVKRVVYFFLDGTLGEQKKKDFSSHLSLCPECEARMRFHRRLRIFFRTRLARITAPDRLKQRLARTLRALSTQWS